MQIVESFIVMRNRDVMQQEQGLPRLNKLWLSTNRHGRLTSDQWLMLVTEPLLPIVALSIPLVFVMAFTPARLLMRYGRYGSWVLVALVAAVMIMLFMRARRYAVQPVLYDVFYAEPATGAIQKLFSRALTVYTRDGHPVAFNKNLTQLPEMAPDMPYIIYYIEDGKRRVLLSAAPAEHPDADRWRPSERFYTRQRRRGSKA